MSLRPPAREDPGPGQRSVWDFPRPPAVEQWHEHVEVLLGGQRVAVTDEAWCVLETSHPPTYYLPRTSFADGVLQESPGGETLCEWKGVATYLDVVVARREGGDPVVARRAAWTYPAPTPAYAMLRDHVAIYPSLMDSCLVDGQPVRPQPGGFYGGWVTPRVVGPFKGSPGTLAW